MSDILTDHYDKELQQWILSIIEKARAGDALTDQESTVLFHWTRHKDDPTYSFVPEEYRKF